MIGKPKNPMIMKSALDTVVAIADAEGNSDAIPAAPVTPMSVRIIPVQNA